MGRSIGLAIAATAAAIVAGTAVLSAQGAPGSSPRPFKRLFAKPLTPGEVPPAIEKQLRRLQALPSGTKCHIVVVPADPMLDPRFSVEPPSTTRFRIREARTDRICR
jgi:hypothetical protein